MKIRAIAVAAAATFGAVALNAATYDYWSALSAGGMTSSPAGTIDKVLVIIGNNGVVGSNAGPQYDVVLTVRTADGAPVCSASSVRQPPIIKGQQRIALAFQVSYTRPNGGAPDPQRTVRYLLQSNITTGSPGEDANPANGSQSKTFAFRSDAKTSCETLLTH